MPKRVLHLIETSGAGGAERMLVSLVEALAGAGVASTVVLLREGWLSSELRNHGAEVEILPRGRFRWSEAGWLLRARRLIRRRRVDLIHAHEFRMNAYAALLTTLAGVPAVATVHGRNYYGDRYRRRMVYRFVAGRAAMVAVSADIAAYLHDRVGVPERRLQVVPNGIDVARLHCPGALRREVRRALGYDAAAVVVGAVGSLYPVKGHELLVRAAAALLSRLPQLHFFVAGCGGEEGRLRRLIAEAGIGERFRLLGHRDDIPALLGAADIFALPSRSEGHPLSLLEAMAARRPAVAAAVGGVPEVITDGANGLLFPGGDADALALALQRLAEAPSLRRGLGEAGYATVASHYGIETMLRRYRDLYDTAIRRRAVVLRGAQEPGT